MNCACEDHTPHIQEISLSPTKEPGAYTILYSDDESLS